MILLPIGVQSNNKWHRIGGPDQGTRMGLQSAGPHRALVCFEDEARLAASCGLCVLPLSVRGGQCLNGNQAEAAGVCVYVCEKVLCV